MTHRPLNGRSLTANLLLLATVLATSCATAAPRLSRRQGPFSFEVLVDGRRAPTFAHRGETYVLGQLGRRYTLRVHNHSGRRVEVVATVDGRDVLDGRPGSFRKRGYLLPAWGSLTIEGWRLSHAEIAAFRFSRVADSYAARTGSDRHVGVIGVAIFPERPRPEPIVEPYAETEDDAPAAPFQEQARLRRAPAAQPPAGASEASGGAAADEAEPPAAGRSGLRDRHAPSYERRGLGTAFGERHYAPVNEVPFERANSDRPSYLLGARYNDRRGLLALGVDLSGWSWRGDDTDRRRSASPFPAQRDFAAPPSGWDE